MNNIDEIIENNKRRDEQIAGYACKDSMAFRERCENGTLDIRTPYAKDVDRIIHSFSYTRYMDKTQVFSMLNDDRISTRMIHVQLVSKVARTIGRALNLNEDLIESISLGHDIGHVPFGHQGERMLNTISLAEGEGYFNHNVHGIRVFMDLEKNGQGINLTFQTLDGILCHNGELVKDIYEPNYSKTWDDFMKEYRESYNDPNSGKSLRSMTLEGCVVRVSDIIAYIGRDVEDAIDVGLINRNDLPLHIREILGDENGKMINELVLDVIKNSYGKKYISLSDKVYNALIDLKKYNYEHIYSEALNKAQLDEIEEKFNKLYRVYLKDLETGECKTGIYNLYLKNMTKEYLDTTSNKRKVIDYIAGMTDRFFLDQYKKIFE